MEASSSPRSLDRGAAELEGLAIDGVPLNPHKAGGWSPLLLSSELLLASHGQQLACIPQVFVCLEVSWTMGKQEALEEGLLWEVVVTHPVCQAESFEPSQSIGLCGLVYPSRMCVHC